MSSILVVAERKSESLALQVDISTENGTFNDVMVIFVDVLTYRIDVLNKENSTLAEKVFILWMFKK